MHFDRKGMSNHEKEGTSTLTRPARRLLEGECEYCLQNWKMVLSILVIIDFNESVWYCDLITVVCHNNNYNYNKFYYYFN